MLPTCKNKFYLKEILKINEKVDFRDQCKCFLYQIFMMYGNSMFWAEYSNLSFFGTEYSSILCFVLNMLNMFNLSLDWS